MKNLYNMKTLLVLRTLIMKILLWGMLLFFMISFLIILAFVETFHAEDPGMSFLNSFGALLLSFKIFLGSFLNGILFEDFYVACGIGFIFQLFQSFSLFSMPLTAPRKILSRFMSKTPRNFESYPYELETSEVLKSPKLIMKFLFVYFRIATDTMPYFDSRTARILIDQGIKDESQRSELFFLLKIGIKLQKVGIAPLTVPFFERRFDKALIGICPGVGTNQAIWLELVNSPRDFLSVLKDRGLFIMLILGEAVCGLPYFHVAAKLGLWKSGRSFCIPHVRYGGRRIVDNYLEERRDGYYPLYILDKSFQKWKVMLRYSKYPCVAEGIIEAYSYWEDRWKGWWIEVFIYTNFRYTEKRFKGAIYHILEKSMLEEEVRKAIMLKDFDSPLLISLFKDIPDWRIVILELRKHVCQLNYDVSLNKYGYFSTLKKKNNNPQPYQLGDVLVVCHIKSFVKILHIPHGTRMNRGFLGMRILTRNSTLFQQCLEVTVKMPFKSTPHLLKGEWYINNKDQILKELENILSPYDLQNLIHFQKFKRTLGEEAVERLRAGDFNSQKVEIPLRILRQENIRLRNITSVYHLHDVSIIKREKFACSFLNVCAFRKLIQREEQAD